MLSVFLFNSISSVVVFMYCCVVAEGVLLVLLSPMTCVSMYVNMYKQD